MLRSAVAGMPEPQAGRSTLSAVSNIAGNLPLLDSVANLSVAEITTRWRVELRFWDYTKAELVITLLSLVVGLGWMQLFLW